MMDIDSTSDVISRNPKIATVVPDDDLVTDLFPSLGMVELLIDVPVESECLFSDNSVKPQVLEPFFKCR